MKLVYALFYLVVAASLLFPPGIPQIYQHPIGRGALVGLLIIWGYYGSALLGILGAVLFLIQLHWKHYFLIEGMTTTKKKEKKGEMGVDLETIKTSLQAQNSKQLATPKSTSLHTAIPSYAPSKLATTPI